MKTRLRHLLSILAGFLFIFILSPYGLAQEIISPLVQMSEIQESPIIIKNQTKLSKLEKQQKIYAFSISGTLKFTSKNGLFRVVLHGVNGEEFLVYQNIGVFNEVGKEITLTNACYESALLPGVIPSQIEIITKDCEYNQTSVSYGDRSIVGYPMLKLRYEGLKSQAVYSMIDRISEYNRANRLPWIARNTRMSMLSYSDKKKAFNIDSKDFLMYGFEHYAGGVYTPLVTDLESTDYEDVGTSPYVEEFDWRNRHGINWNTPCKDQFQPFYTPSCWAFAAISNMESYVNLFAGKKLDYSLSVQDVVSCSGGMSACYCEKKCEKDVIHVGSHYMALKYATRGVVSDEDFPFTGKYIDCENKPSLPKLKVRAGSIELVSVSKRSLMEGLINNGPLSIGVFYK